jgi:hypothetical protein
MQNSSLEAWKIEFIFWCRTLIVARSSVSVSSIKSEPGFVIFVHNAKN